MTGIRPAGWRTPQGRDAYLDAYDAAMGRWPVPFTSRYVLTRFGQTHVVDSGPPDGAAVVLLHAATGFGAVQWYPNAAGLTRTRRTLAPDFIGSAGRGTMTRPILTEEDCADWVGDILDGLGLDRCPVIGSSQSGWLALNHTLRSPERVDALVLLAPAATVLPFRPMMQAFIRLGPFMPAWTGPPSIRGLFGGRTPVDERIVRLLTLHLKRFRYQRRAVFPTAFAPEQLHRVAVPTLLMIGQREVIYDPHRALDRARRLIPDVETELVPDCGHLINMEQRPSLTSGSCVSSPTTQPATTPPPAVAAEASRSPRRCAAGRAGRAHPYLVHRRDLPRARDLGRLAGTGGPPRRRRWPPSWPGRARATWATGPAAHSPGLPSRSVPNTGRSPTSSSHPGWPTACRSCTSHSWPLP